jgi:hypothetical protein
MRSGFLHACGREENNTMLDDILDLFKRDRNDQNRQRSSNGVRGLLDRLGDHDDDRSPATSRHRHHDDDWDDEDQPPRRDSGRRRRESSDWFD